MNQLIKSEQNPYIKFYLSSLDDWVRQASGFAAKEETHYHTFKYEWEREMIQKAIIPNIRSLIEESADSRVAALLSALITLLEQGCMI